MQPAASTPIIPFRIEDVAPSGAIRRPVPREAFVACCWPFVAIFVIVALAMKAAKL